MSVPVEIIVGILGLVGLLGSLSRIFFGDWLRAHLLRLYQKRIDELMRGEGMGPAVVFWYFIGAASLVCVFGAAWKIVSKILT